MNAKRWSSKLQDSQEFDLFHSRWRTERSTARVGAELAGGLLVYRADGFGSSADRTALDKELEVWRAYQWCSAPRSILGCIHTCRPCRSRARHTAGGKLSDCTLGRSSLPHTDRCLPCKHRVCRSPRNIFLYCQKEEFRQEKRMGGGGGEGGLLRPLAFVKVKSKVTVNRKYCTPG